ncbi:MAG: methyltransferase domain-containing protein [Streptosporangiales bacterium]|nr:methyltransferase domain-containing protein [Streptosporangiales bacterium]
MADAPNTAAPEARTKTGAPLRPRNHPAQYDDLADQWWKPRGAFAMLHWIAAARARLVPPPSRGEAVLLDVACGGGLLAPHLDGLGYVHIGVDLSPTAATVAHAHGVDAVVRGDACRLPFADASVDVVVAGEILEHVPDRPLAVAECCRVLRPGGTLVLDTVADTWLARLLVVTVAERIPGAAPRHIHDPALFVDRRALLVECASHGVRLRLNGLRPSLVQLLGWLARRRGEVDMVPGGPTTVLFQGVGVKVGSMRRTAAP